MPFVKEKKNPQKKVKHLTKCQKEEKLQTICHASTSKFNKNILNIYT